MNSNILRALTVWAAIAAVLCGFAYQHYRIVALQQRLDGWQGSAPLLRTKIEELEKRFRLLAEIQPRTRSQLLPSKGPLTDTDIQTSARLADTADEVRELKSAVQEINRVLSNERPDTVNFRQQLSGGMEQLKNDVGHKLSKFEETAQVKHDALKDKIDTIQNITLVVAGSLVLPMGIYLFSEQRKLRNRRKMPEDVD